MHLIGKVCRPFTISEIFSIFFWNEINFSFKFVKVEPAYVQNSLILKSNLRDGHLKRLLKSIKIEYNIQNKIHFHQALPGETIRLYKYADLGMIPYKATCLNICWMRSKQNFSNL